MLSADSACLFEAPDDDSEDEFESELASESLSLGSEPLSSDDRGPSSREALESLDSSIKALCLLESDADGVSPSESLGCPSSGRSVFGA